MTNFTWPDGKRAAVSLTYDDGIDVHVDHVAPELEARGFAGTFYVPIHSTVIERLEDWRAVAVAGHELGNHTIFHPCRMTEKSTWLPAWRNLAEYMPGEYRQELALANRFLKMVDGREMRSFGNTCHNVTIGSGEGEVAVEPIVGDMFVAMRGADTGELVDPVTCDLNRLGCLKADFRPFDALKQEIDQVLEQGKWLIYCAHGVGGGHSLSWSDASHRQTLDYLAECSEIWVAPLADIAEWIAKQRN